MGRFYDQNDSKILYQQMGSLIPYNTSKVYSADSMLNKRSAYIQKAVKFYYFAETWIHLFTKMEYPFKY